MSERTNRGLPAEAVVVGEMKNQTKEHRLWLGDILKREEDRCE